VLDELAPWFDVQIAGEGVRLIGEGSSGYSFFILLVMFGTGVSALEHAHPEIAGRIEEAMRQRVSVRA